MGIGGWIAIFCINIPLGYGLASLIMAHWLEGSNVIGNSRSDIDRISSPISYTAKTDNIAMDPLGFDYFSRGHLKKLKSMPEHIEAKSRSIPKDSYQKVEPRS